MESNIKVTKVPINPDLLEPIHDQEDDEEDIDLDVYVT
jgi:hypothetical protein